MSSRDDHLEESPAFEQPVGVPSWGEERTVPLGDVHPPVDSSPWAPAHSASAPSEPTVPLGDPYTASAAPEHTLPIVEPNPYGSSGSSRYTAPAGDSYSASAAVPEHMLPVVDLYPTAENWGGATPQASSDDYRSSGYATTQQPGGQRQPPYPAVMPQPPYQGQWVQQHNPYMQQPGPYAMAPAEHPQATTVLVLGAVSVGVPILSFVAWYMGSKAKKEIGRGAPYAYTGNLKVGHVLGKVIGILTIVGASLYGVFLVFYLILLLGLAI